ncbi:unnamed protein product [Owenia fusiformis]|uniref:Uncharacterized protein n=1 Tax=Owenia fusiformis TaxID=6347 RepID=A0A8J1XW78_OWEFU|nr:unnamed protein product [Owenia fusiformis]
MMRIMLKKMKHFFFLSFGLLLVYNLYKLNESSKMGEYKKETFSKWNIVSRTKLEFRKEFIGIPRQLKNISKLMALKDDIMPITNNKEVKDDVKTKDDITAFINNKEVRDDVKTKDDITAFINNKEVKDDVKTKDDITAFTNNKTKDEIIAFINNKKEVRDDVKIKKDKNYIVTNTDQSEGFLVKTPGCSIPDIDPWDHTIQHFINKNKRLDCDTNPSITYTSGNILKINHNIVQSHYPNFSHCGYRGIYRVKGEDNAYTMDAQQTKFKQDVHLKVEYIKVKCYDRNGKTIYKNFHAVVFEKQQVEDECKRNTVERNEKLNIVLLGVDSVSRLNFMRLMPKTRRFIEEELNGFELTGYNKVGDNTFPNLVPLLSGKFAADLPWNSATDRGKPFDEFKFIWNEAAKKGYRTLFAEDAPKWALFNYLKGGFHKQPTDYYSRPFHIALELEESVWQKAHCVGDRHESEITLNYLYDYMDTFKDRPHFAFTFNSRLTHEDISLTGVADNIYLKFLKRVKNCGNLNNSVVVFYSDHGIRYGDMRQTKIGKLEEKLPFIYWIFPKWFSENHPEFVHNLRINKHRLTTPFDVHETLQNILTDGPLESFTSDPNKKGMSLFKVIPETRTCEDVGILPHWCTCQNMKPISTKDTTVKQVANFTISSINKHLSHLQNSDLCAILSLDKITKAEMYVSTKDILKIKSADGFDSDKTEMEKASTPIEYYQIEFVASPGNGVFEATVRYSNDDKIFDIPGPISRLNRYGHQSACIKNLALEKFCYCNNKHHKHHRLLDPS